jgi:hypothetical protein
MLSSIRKMATHQQNREIAVRIRHLGIVVQDLERTAEFYENVLGFKRLGDARTPGHYPGKALDLSCCSPTRRSNGPSGRTARWDPTTSV